MTQTLSFFPGQKVTIFLETIDAIGTRTDGYLVPNGFVLPVISQIVFPNLTNADGFPQAMTKMDIGLYYFKFSLPSGAASVGTYLVTAQYLDPVDLIYKDKIYQVVVTAPFGNFSAMPGP